MDDNENNHEAANSTEIVSDRILETKPSKTVNIRPTDTKIIIKPEYAKDFLTGDRRNKTDETGNFAVVRLSDLEPRELKKLLTTKGIVDKSVITEKNKDDGSSKTMTLRQVLYDVVANKDTENVFKRSQETLFNNRNMSFKKTENIKYIVWVRHAYSCANLMKKVGQKRFAKHFGIKIGKAEQGNLQKNALLSKIGIKQANKLSKELNGKIGEIEINKYYTSELRRAIQTGYYSVSDKLSDNNKLTIIPYVGEIRNKAAKTTGKDKNNLPFKLHITKKWVEQSGKRVKQDFDTEYPDHSPIKIQVKKLKSVDQNTSQLLTDAEILLAKSNDDELRSYLTSVYQNTNSNIQVLSDIFIQIVQTELDRNEDLMALHRRLHGQQQDQQQAQPQGQQQDQQPDQDVNTFINAVRNALTEKFKEKFNTSLDVNNIDFTLAKKILGNKNRSEEGDVELFNKNVLPRIMEGVENGNAIMVFSHRQFIKQVTKTTGFLDNCGIVIQPVVNNKLAYPSVVKFDGYDPTKGINNPANNINIKNIKHMSTCDNFEYISSKMEEFGFIEDEEEEDEEEDEDEDEEVEVEDEEEVEVE